MPEGICDESGGIRPYRSGRLFRVRKKKMGVKQSALKRGQAVQRLSAPPEKSGN
jgi:hypothetical protein